MRLRAALVAALVAHAAVADAQPPLQWIDVHSHPIAGRAPNFRAMLDEAAQVMEGAGIRRMVLMPPPQVNEQGALYDQESFALMLKDYGGRFAFLGGGGSLNAMLHEHARDAVVVADVRRRFEEQAETILRVGAAGFGEIAAHHVSLRPGHPYETVAADHPLLLLLADIAARHVVPIDLHFDVVAQEIDAPAWMSAPNPERFEANLPAFERLLAHNRKARIVWAHAGSDMFGHWTPGLTRRLLAAHPNLYMSLRPAPGRFPANHPLDANGKLKPEWLALLKKFPDRFVIGADQFFVAKDIRGGIAQQLAQRNPMVRERTQLLLRQLPAEVARSIGVDNALKLYRMPPL